MVQDLTQFLKNAPFELSEADREVIAQKNEDFVSQTWEDLKNAIAAKNLGSLKRAPSDMRNYLLWTNETLSQYGSVSKYVLQHRLGWETTPDASPSNQFGYRNETPFADTADYRILRNDWPYGLTKDITHLVVWLKTPVAITPEGDPTPDSHKLIEEFIDQRLKQMIKPNPKYAEQTIWFKQRAQWQSVRALEHIHVLVRGVDESLIEQWTGMKAKDITARVWPRKVLESSS